VSHQELALFEAESCVMGGDLGASDDGRAARPVLANAEVSPRKQGEAAGSAFEGGSSPHQDLAAGSAGNWTWCRIWGDPHRSEREGGGRCGQASPGAP